jgi:nucleolar complex protein 3
MVTKDVKRMRYTKEELTAKSKLPAKPMLPPQTTIGNLDSPISELTIAQRCELIAEISESVLEDPQSAFLSDQSHNDGDSDDEGTGGPKTPSKMRKLLEMATPSKNGDDDISTRLGVLSLLAIFQDIIPSYRIRLPTASERAVRVTKDVKTLWDYEGKLLLTYQQYLKLLDSLWKSGCGKQTKRQDAAISTIAVTAILCLCELLKSASHFNFRSNVLSIVVRQMNHGKCEEVSTACCTAVAYVFKNDKQGEIALEAARSISKMIKEKYNKGVAASLTIRPALVRTFLSLPLRVHEDEAQAAKLAEQANSKRRKKDQDSKEIDEDLKEADATVDKILLARSQADTLHAVTLTYFRILKGVNLVTANEHGKKKNIEIATTLLAPALEGLAKFAHLINFDTVIDVLTVLKGLLKTVETLPLDASLNCILTAFQTLQGPGRELQIDQKEYVSPLYSQLPRLISEGNGSSNTDLALRCLTSAFMKRKEYSTIRVAAFAKQLGTVAMHAPAYTSAPLLAFLRQLLHRYPSAAQLLENEEDVVTQGTYTPEADDPEYTNPFATSAWELGTLKFHFNPSVRGHAKGAGAKKMLMLPAEDPSKIRAELLRNSQELHIAHRVNKKKHPLTVAAKKDKRRRAQVRFITPRQTQNYHLR